MFSLARIGVSRGAQLWFIRTGKNSTRLATRESHESIRRIIGPAALETPAGVWVATLTAQRSPDFVTKLSRRERTYGIDRKSGWKLRPAEPVDA
jgi:hypothetical protein